jgi:hypothetical protein
MLSFGTFYPCFLLLSKQVKFCQQTGPLVKAHLLAPYELVSNEQQTMEPAMNETCMVYYHGANQSVNQGMLVTIPSEESTKRRHVLKGYLVTISSITKKITGKMQKMNGNQQLCRWKSFIR